MRKFNDNINPFKTREDILNSLRDLLLPLSDYFIRDNTRIHISNSGTNDSLEDLTDFELFSRILWGLIPAGNIYTFDTLWEKVQKGISNGVASDNEDYFGDPKDYSQILVEMAAFAYGLILNKEKMWHPLDNHAKENIVKWLKKANDCEYYNCNWKFFNVLVNLGLKSIGEKMDTHKMNSYLDDIDSYYYKDGWYFDGVIGESHADYYIPFAIHFYSLVYVKEMYDIDRERCDKYIDRAKKFAQSFIYWFSSDGSALPYGRSLNYRFAQVTFFSAVLYSGVDIGFDLGVIKGIILRHLRYWFSQPILDSSGHLTLGYIYPNMNFPEGYMAPGSPYWALKTYLILMLDEDHEFWSVDEKPLPQMKNMLDLPAPFLKIMRNNESSHILAYNGGNLHSNNHNHVEAKYEKFVYSNIFGFSVSRSNLRLQHGAYDNMLAVADEYGYFRSKQKSISRKIYKDYIYTRWSPYSYVYIDTYIVTGNPWHVRVHIINTEQSIRVADGGFALGLELLNKNKQKINYNKLNGIMAIGEECYSGIFNMLGYDEMEFIHPSGNTNTHNPMTVLPTLQKHLDKGRHTLISYVVGDLHSNSNYNDYLVSNFIIGEDYIGITVNNRVIKMHYEN